MAGFPTETEEDTKETFRLIDQLTEIDQSIYIPGISIYTPFPGTDLYSEAVKLGFKEPKNLEGWGNYEYNNINNLPWIKGEYKNLLKTISMLTRFQFNSTKYEHESGLKNTNKLYYFAYKFFCNRAKSRWANKNFKFPIEWRLLEKSLKIMGITER